MGSIVLPPRAPTHNRKHSFNLTNKGILSLSTKNTANVALPTGKREVPIPPPLPPRRNTVNKPPLKLHSVTLSGGMESRYNRPSSPRNRYVNPARSSTGTFGDPYHDSLYYGGRTNTSPRSSGDRFGSSYQPHATVYTPSSSSGSRTSALKYDSYSGRPRRNTLNDDERTGRPNLREILPLPPTSSIPIRSPAFQHNFHHNRPSSPLASSFDSRGDTYIHGPTRHEHKRIYSVDDNSHKARLVAEREVIEPRRQDSRSQRDYNVTSGGRSYHTSSSKSQPRPTDLNDDGYSYTDAAGMYRDTEPAWRRPRSGSVERGSRPSSLIVDNRAPRSSARELGPPPSMRGFDKINNGIPRRDHHARSSSIERSREVPKYDPYPEAAPSRSSSTRHHAPAIHQEPRDHRRDTTHDSYDRRDYDSENRRQPAPERFEDRDVAARGFGIAPGLVNTPAERQPIWSAHEQARPRADEYTTPYYPPERAVDPRASDSRVARDREAAPRYDERPQERRDTDDRNHHSSVAPIAAGAAVGAVATFGAAQALKSREADRERDSERDREYERERERRREMDERDRRDRGSEDRRDRASPDERKDDRVPLASAAYASTQDPDRKPPRDRRYDEEDRSRESREPRESRSRRHEDEGRERKSRRAASSDGSGDERARHYVDREGRDSDRRKDAAPEAALDPDEEYRRRIQQEMDRSGRSARDSDSDREKDRRRRKEARDRSRDASRGPSSGAQEPRSEGRSSNVLDTNITQEPDSIPSPSGEQSKSVQIVTPPKEAEPKPKGILRKPTEKFPEDPDPIREGVAPHKSQLKGKDIPVGARWTKIDRRLVNPEALLEAQERFEERMDCVIVLRVLTKEQIQKLADRTKEIREAREDEYERREGRERDYRDRDRERDRDYSRHRSHHDVEDRERGRARDYDDDDYDDVGRRDYERRRDRDQPRMIEASR
ncbi:hypothetical protein BU24DRAFT_406391 [Aaosphaeria arxii CBS 175.79]|uniref:DUF8035 domain-containing protein n=1 Tax=Aaosphaeria arxii CBS 175.79 TaxID=1450172 RepID=A0A6A5Y2H4_9PLEO|nr:uncharacterized protein BU24DRAFT_406391 [Aaosphaeria arxii CBS 175.79]KAF2019765.1 hypothetical protein BU24DRAFT_406391 [Aaosphaeria arxii CBS 175.79]